MRRRYYCGKYFSLLNKSNSP